MSVKLLFAALLAGAAGFFGGQLGIEQLPKPAPKEPVTLELLAPPALADLAVSSREGTVEHALAGLKLAAIEGDDLVLTPGHRLRTGPDGRATVRLGVASAITLEPATELVVKEAPGVLELVSGAATVRLAHPGREVRVEGAGAAVLLDAEEGSATELALLHAGTKLGTVALAGSRGTTITAGEARVIVTGGSATWASKAGVESPVPAPRAPKLVLDGLAAADDGRVVLSGTASSWARVLVEGIAVLPDADGRFSATVPGQVTDRLEVTAWVPGVEPTTARTGKEPASVADAGKVATPDGGARPDASPDAGRAQPETVAAVAKPVEEPAVEEPVAEEPVAEEPVVEEPVVEEPDEPVRVVTKRAKTKKKSRSRARRAKKKEKKKAVAKKKGGVTWGKSSSSGGGGVTWGGKK